jgi:hypothetical protein
MAIATPPAYTAAMTSATLVPTGAARFTPCRAHVDGGPEGNLVLEFDAIDGQPVAAADHGLVTESVADPL